jgi:hypothetical protein
VSETIESLLEHIPRQSVVRAVLRANRRYLGVRLIHGADTDYADLFLYVGKSSQLPPVALSKPIGLILQNDAGLDIADVSADCVELADCVDLPALYEELIDLWHHNEIGASVSALTTLVNSGNIHVIVESASKILQNPIFILNKDSCLMDCHCDSPVDEENILHLLKHGHFSSEQLKRAHLSESCRMVVHNSAPAIVDSPFRNGRRNLTGIIKSGGRGVGTVIVSEYGHKFTAADIDVVNLICGVISQLLSDSRRHGSGNLTDFTYEHHLNALLDGEATNISWIPGWLARLRWTGRRNFYLFALIAPSGISNSPETARLRAQMQCIEAAYTFLHDRNLLMVLNAENKASLARCVAQLSEILPPYNIRAGVSDRFDSIQQIRGRYQEALDAMRVSDMLGDNAVVSAYAERLVFDLLMKAKGPTRRYGDCRLSLLREYDRKNGTDYYETLYLFLKNAFNKTQTANRLFIHRNTLSYRLLKIAEFLELDLGDGDDCQKLYLAFKSMELDAASDKARDK